MFGESAVDEFRLVSVEGDVGRGLRKIILSMKIQLEETKKGVKCRTNKTDGWQWIRKLKLTCAE
jgi:hypothetical protein